ncbi:BgTH12-05016 [Blumeria graminis f. sp. triticale]|uniref:BgTH12-05016 n=1 Tax=Blumeria graminis f. sp. triticale TaxID=1689686 RepID=A0A9W4DIK7_BLUGR|nr:BgTH12-05016 [Blumeria graminis f. sp. triticale]
MRTFSLMSLAAILSYLKLPSVVGYSPVPVAEASSYKCQDRVIGPVTLNDQINKAYAEAQSNQSRGLTREQIFASRQFRVILTRDGERILIQFYLSINNVKEILSLQAYVMNQLFTCHPTTEPPQLNEVLH